jgi:hypothetical protein
MRSIGDIADGRQTVRLVDPYVRSVFRAIPSELLGAMASAHDGDLGYVYACRECWLVAKQTHEQMIAMAERISR